MQNVKEGMKTDFLPTVLGQALPHHWISAIRNCGACRIEELRLHAGRIARTVDRGLTYPTDLIPRAEELAEVLKRLCGGSLYAYANTINQGYLTVEGGIRIGVCGSAALEGGRIIGVHNVTGLIIRIPHAVKLSTAQIADIFFAGLLPRGILFYSLPGVGKTTVLRSLARELSSPHRGLHTVAVDTREELSALLSGENLDLDVLFGYPRAVGFEIAVRSLRAEVVLCDEIGSCEDADAILFNAGCGVPLIATAHASSCRELLSRPHLRRLHDNGIFGAYIGLERKQDQPLRFHVTDWQTAEQILHGTERRNHANR